MKPTTILFIIPLIAIALVSSFVSGYLAHEKGYQEGLDAKLSAIPPKEISILAEKKRCDQENGRFYFKDALSSRVGDRVFNPRIWCEKTITQTLEAKTTGTGTTTAKMTGTVTLFEYEF